MEEGKTEVLRLRLTPAEKAFVQSKAKNNGIKMSEYVRRVLLKK